MPILKAELERANAEFPSMLEEETLWEYLHRRDLEFWGSDNFLVTPVFIFDQFEELFSKGAGSPRRTSETFRDLADLAANTIPSSLNEPSAKDRCATLDLLSHRYRVVLSFREDFLPQMKDWEHQVPSLLRNYLHLQPMSGTTAIQAVERAGVEVLEPGVAQRIVDFVGRQDSDSQRCETENLVIEPVLLSLCCSELNRRRIPPSKIDRVLVKTAGEDILETFYRTALNDPQVKRGPNVAMFIEERLIQGDRFRSDYPVDEALKNSLLSENQLKVLTDVHRLLRIVPHTDTVRVELIHDRLVPVVSKARNERRKTKKRNRRFLMAGVTGLLIVGLAVIWEVVTRAYMTQSRILAADAWRGIANDPARSAQIALAALEINPANQGAVDVLRQSLLPLQTAHTKKIIEVGTSVSDVQYSKDGSLLVVASGARVSVYDSRTFERRYAFLREGEVLRAWLLRGNKMLVTHSDDGHAQIQGVEESVAHELSCRGEQDSVYTIAASPDDSHVAIGCRDGDVLVWNTATMSDEPSSTYHHKLSKGVTVTALAFSDDGHYLASGDALGSVNVWKLDHPTPWIGVDDHTGTGSPIKHERYYSIRDIGFHRDDPGLIVTAGDDRQAIVWRLDLEHRRIDRDEQRIPQKWPLKHKREVIVAKFTPPRDGLYPVMTVSGKTAQLWQDSTVNDKQGRAHDDWIMDARSSDSGEWLVTASADNTARIWSTRLGSTFVVLRRHRDTVRRAVFSPNAEHVVTGGADGMVRVWKFQPRVEQLVQLEHWVLDATFDSVGKRVAVGNEGGAFILNLDSEKSIMPAPQDLPGVNFGQVSNLTWGQRDKYLLGLQSSSSIDQRVRPILWELGDKPEVITPKWFGDMLSAAFTPQGDEVVTVSKRGQVAIWDTKALSESMSEPKARSKEKLKRWMATMSRDRQWVAVLNGKAIELFHRDDLSIPVRQFEGHEGDVKSLQFSNDGKWLLTASADKTARIWSVEGTSKPKVLEGGHSAALYSASYSPNGEWIITGSVDSTIRVWNAQTAKPVATLRRHSEGVNSVVFSPDGSQILSASDDGTVQIGQCEVCTMTVSELKQHAAKLVLLPGNELVEIMKRTKISSWLLSDFISRVLSTQ